MSLRWRRVVIGALLAEALPIVALVALVAAFGPQDAAQAQAYAASLGRWVGPIGGSVAAFGAAYLVARPLRAHAVAHGLALGVLAALVDGALLVAAESNFEWLFAVSNAGRVVAGGLGGLAAHRAVAQPR